MTYYFVNTVTNCVTTVYALTCDEAWLIYIEYLKKKHPQTGMLFSERSLSDIRTGLEHDVFVTTEVEHAS